METERIGLPFADGIPDGATAASFSKRWFGTATQTTSKVVSVLTTGTQLVTVNPRRIFVYVQNLAVNNGSLLLPQDVAGGIGILLGANGGYASMRVDTDGELTTYELRAIQSIAAGNWYVMETFTP